MMRTWRRGALWAAFLIGVTGFAAVVWWTTFTAALDQLEERGQSDLSQAVDRVDGELRRMRDLADLLADHPTLRPLLTGNSDAIARGDALLQDIADRTGAVRIRLVDGQGTIIAASDGERAGQQVQAAAYARALHGALGWERRIEDDQRLYTTGAPVFSDTGPVIGAVLVEIAMSTLEENWPAGPTPAFFTDPGGLVFTSNRADLVGTIIGVDGTAPVVGRRDLRGWDIWEMAPSRSLPHRALHFSRAMPGIGMQGEVLVSIAPALRLAGVQAAAAAALCLAFGVMLFYVAERRRVLAGRLDIEERANAELEARVAERTGLLQALNQDLRREVAEREEAEAALRRAQADLVQAGKLSALGQMSAGISHELNQPLMAIQSFAENGEKFITRGKVDRAEENLGRIKELAHRMGRIIRNLRAFAKQEPAAVTDVDLGAVVDAALEIAAAKSRNAGIEVTWHRPEAPVWVRGGEVRLQQVVLNLVGNAVEAMAASDEKQLKIDVTLGDPVVLSLRDTGPGIDDPEKIFDPFYTTKAVGTSEGMGLGLSISYGLVQSFGGAIRGRNHPDGGAVFSVELAPGEGRRAA